MRYSLPRNRRISVKKAFLRPHLGYCDAIHDTPFNEKFIYTLELIQHSATLAVTGAVKRLSEEKFSNELAPECLRDRRWMRRLCLFQKPFKLKSPK